jgi:chromosome segregation protein
LGGLLRATEMVAERARAATAALEETVEATRARTEGTAGGMRDREGTEAGLQLEMQQMTARSTDLRVSQALFYDRRTVLEDELAELCRRHMSPRGLVPEDVVGESSESLAAAVERAERRRERIGPINPLAEQECAEMEERARFLAEERADLEASVTQLLDVIAELDEHIETTFSEIFESARLHFSAVIASVFPGAKGTLKLTEPKRARGEPAEGAVDGGSTAEGLGMEEGPGAIALGDEPTQQNSGIEIEVRFPNKAPRSLSLLSGGEKAMTAIAFLFSLFLARPCPFYILDEVEASLDDINIRRFLTLVRKYRDKTQFIIITHQRQTMEVADTLYGVTLESDGTSRILSRRLATAKGA